MKRVFQFLTVGLIVAAPSIAAAQSPIQIALFTPIQIVPEDQAVRGIRWNLIYGSNTSVVGLDVGLVNRATAGVSKGVQWGLVGISDGGFQGWQSNFINLTKQDFAGLQEGAFNSVENGEGVQLGAVNYASTRFSGLQLSIVNFAEDMNGLQIGLINIIKSKDKFPVLPIVNWKFD